MPRKPLLMRNPAGDQPRYRFRGALPPTPGCSTPILDAITAIDEGDGTATLRIYDPVDSWGGEWGVSAKEVAAGLDALPESIHSIRLHINSPGGEVWEGIAITNLLRRHSARVTAIVDGIAASAASFIAASMDELVMAPNSQLMIHDAWGIAIGDAATMRDTAELLDKVSDNIADMYARKAGGDRAEWRAVMQEEAWYNADEAVAAGLADRVEEQAPTAEPKAAFDLSVFAYAGRDDAPAPPLPSQTSGAAPSDGTAALRARLHRRTLRQRAS